MASEILALQWLEHQNIFNQAIGRLRNKSSFTDATLACEGKFYPVHKFVLCTCSEYFSAIFDWTPCVNPVIVINNIPSHTLESLLDFMYRGEAHVSECHIQDVMKAAECLHIKGLSLRQDESLLTKHRSGSPVSSEEPKRKRRKSDVKMMCSHFAKPHMQEDSFYTQQISPGQSSTSFVTTPVPTPSSSTPVHKTSPHSLSYSPHNTPPIHSPSLHSSSPITMPSVSSPVSQASLSSQISQAEHQIQSSPSITVTVPSPVKSLLVPLSQVSEPNQHMKILYPFKNVAQSSHIDSIQHHMEPFETQVSQQHGDQYSCLKTEHTSLVFSSLPSLTKTEDSSSVLPITDDQAVQFSKFASGVLPERSAEESQQPASIDGSASSLSQIDKKMIGIGEELHLEGPIKELEITTEDGSVSIPEILEGLVNMRHLYEAKVTQAEEAETQGNGYRSAAPKSMEGISQCSTSETPVALLHFKEETSESMYEFHEELPETSGIGRLNMLKDKNLKTYSNSGSNVRKKNNSFPLEGSTKFAADGEPSSVSLLESSQLADGKKEVKGPFVCTTCDRVCKKKDSLTRHMRTHSEFPYTCTVCSLKCKVYKEFISHRKIHATKRCDKCDFVTIRNDNLRRHMLSHQEEKNHKCPYDDCTYSSSRVSLLNSHVQNHHMKKTLKDDDKKK